MLPQDFFTTKYLFSINQPANMEWFLILLGVYVVFIIISILLGYNQTIHKGLRARLFNFFLTIGILGVVISFFRYESTPYVGTRIAMLLLLLATLIWYFVITIYSVTKMRHEVRAIKNHERYIQYLPKKKRKN